MTELEEKLSYLEEIKISRPGTKQEYLSLVAQTEQRIRELQALIPAPEPEPYIDPIVELREQLSATNAVLLDMILGV